MSKLRQTIPARQARAGARPGSTVQPRTTTAPAPVQQQDKRLAQIVAQGGVGVWKVKGSDAPIYALSREQAQTEAQRRGVKRGALSLEGYVKLSDQDRAKLQEATARQQPTSRTPSYRDLMETKGYDKETALRIASDLKESERRSRKPEYGIAETQRREQALKEAGEKLEVDRGRAEVEAHREYIESRGGSVGVLTEAEAARADRTYTTLKSYEVGAGQYDITAALRDKAFTAKELRDMGFSQAAVSDATERVSMSSLPETSGKAKAKATTKTTGAEAFAGAKGKAASSLPTMTRVKPTQPVAKAGILSDVRLLPYRNKDGTYNLQRLVTSSVSTKTIRSAGFTDAQIAQALDAAMLASAQKWTPALVGGLATFSGAKTGVGSVPAIARIDPTAVNPSSSGIKAAATRNLLLRYQNKDSSYDLQKAIEKGVSAKMLQSAGFTEAQIMAAINAAMKASGEKFGRDIAAETGVAAPKPRVTDMTQEERIDALAKVMRGINKEVEQKAISQEAKSRDIIRESERTSVALPGEERTWYHWPSGQTVSDSEYRRVTNDGNNAKAEEYSLSARSARRGAIEAVSTLFPIARSALPEVGRKDTTTADWLITAANVATFAAPFVPKGASSTLQIGAGAIFAGNTAKEWGSMSPAGRTVSTAAAALLLTSGIHGLVQPSFKPVKVPLKDGGEAVVWSGLSVRGKPIVGITKLPPNIKNVAEGWRPITKAETSILGTRKMLTQMGVSEAEINKVLTTVKETKAFQPLRSPYEPKTVKVADVAPRALTPDELSLVLREAQKNSKNVQMVYGSTTIKPQLAPELRNWRQLGDIEIQLKPGVTEQQGAKLAADMVEALNKKAPGKFRIDPGDAKRILVDGHHAVELKLAEVSKLGVEAQYSLTRTGEMSWGMKVAQKPITVNYPGVGKLDIMRLSESGVRKGDSITRAASGGTFAPPAHRTKDIADYYVILRTFKGADVADEWAKLYGFDSAALLKAAAKDPLKLEAWRFTPGKTPGTAPSVSIALPPSMAARVKASSPALYKSITSPVTSASLAARSQSAAASSPVAYTSETSPSGASSIVAEDESPSPTTPSPDEESPSPGSSPNTETSTGGSTGGGTDGGGGTTTTTTTDGGGGGSSGGGGGGGGIYPIGDSKPWIPGGSEPVTRKKRATDLDSEKDKDDGTGRVQWKQGAYWIMVEPPPTEGERQRNVSYSRRPFWGVRKVKGSPEETFAKQGKPPKQFLYEMGVTSASIHSYDKPHLRWRQTRKSGRRRGRVI